MLDIACMGVVQEEMKNCCVSAEAATSTASAAIYFIMVCIFDGIKETVLIERIVSTK